MDSRERLQGWSIAICLICPLAVLGRHNSADHEFLFFALAGCGQTHGKDDHLIWQIADIYLARPPAVGVAALPCPVVQVDPPSAAL